MVYNHIRHHNIYLRPDHFKQNNTFSPGCVVNVHPGLVQIENYEKKIGSSVATQSSPENDIVKQWLEEFHDDYGGGNAKMPDFKHTIVHQSPEEPLSHPRHGYSHHPKATKTSSGNNNRYVSNTTTVTIKGLRTTVLDQEIDVTEEKVTIKEYLLRKCKQIEPIERTNQMEEAEKYLFICKKSDANAVTPFLECKLQLLYQQVVLSGHCFKKMLIPHCTNNCNVRTVGSYRDMLTGHSNPQEEPDVDNAKQWFNLDANPIQPRKHQAHDPDVQTQGETIIPGQQQNDANQQPTVSTNLVSKANLAEQLQSFQEEIMTANEKKSRKESR
eukprot:15366266-Ditylum_brightwellii.AAC.1